MKSEHWVRLITVTATLLGGLPSAWAHGDNGALEVTAVNASAHAGAGVVHSNSTSMGEPSYFQRSEASALLHAHIALMVVAWGAVLPIGT